jgi:hypothetical protein
MTARFVDRAGYVKVGDVPDCCPAWVEIDSVTYIFREVMPEDGVALYEEDETPAT